MSPTDIIASISAGAAILSLIASGAALYLSGRATATTKNIAKRQGVIDLYKAWEGVNDIDVNQPITPDIVRAANAISLTASLWNHDVIEKQILFESYWPAYREIYETLYGMNALIPGKKVSGKKLITSEITKVYEQMKSTELNKVHQTKL